MATKTTFAREFMEFEVGKDSRLYLYDQLNKQGFSIELITPKISIPRRTVPAYKAHLVKQ